MDETTGVVPSERPVVTRFTDYRAYLRAMIAWSKEHRRGFSYRSFAKKAGFSSPSFLKLVADGQRRLSPESVERVALGSASSGARSRRSRRWWRWARPRAIRGATGRMRA